MTSIGVAQDVDLHVVDVGAGDPVVLLHGWGLSHEVWDRQVRMLVERERRVVALDLRGHGGSSKPADGYEVERLAEDVTAVLDHLHLDAVDLVGWSLGGLTAFRVAAAWPARVRRLVLVGSNGVANTRKQGFPFGLPGEDQEVALVTQELEDRLRFRRDVITSAFYEPPSRELADWLVRITHEAPSWVGAACLRTLMRTDQVADAAGLSVPLVQILGAKDPVLSRRGAAWLMEQVPESRQLVVANAGHYPMLEAPEVFDDALIDALQVSAR